MRPTFARFVRLGLCVLPLAIALACSSSSSSNGTSTPCNQNPFECPSGQTCWPTKSGGFACLNSAKGVAKGAACQNYPDSPTCGDNMFCLQQSTAGGNCVTYCDPTNASHGCDVGETCVPVALAGNQSEQTHVCYTYPSDAGGVDGGVFVGQDAATTGDAGSDAAGDATAD